jgi:glycosyl transferase, family 25
MTNSSVPVYVVALENSVRFRNLQSDLEMMNISYTLIKAINGRTLRKDQLRELVNFDSCKSRLGVDISLPLIGCALSHRKAYQEFLNSNHEFAVILEEDVRLHRNFKNFIESLTSELNFQSPTVVQLFTRGERFVSRSEIAKLRNGKDYFEFSSIPGQAAAYLINRSAAQIALSYLEVDGPSDWPNWASKVRFLGIFPFIASETGEGSQIGPVPISNWQFRMRSLSILLGLHFVKYRNTFSSISDYRVIVYRPILKRVKWALMGRPRFPAGDSSDLWIA